MIVYNTTYHVEKGYDESFITWLKTNYIPASLERSELTQPRLAHIMAEDESEGSSYSLQYDVDSIEALSAWYKGCGEQLSQQLTAHFGHKVVGFTTLLQQLTL